MMLYTNFLTHVNTNIQQFGCFAVTVPLSVSVVYLNLNKSTKDKLSSPFPTIYQNYNEPY